MKSKIQFLYMVKYGSTFFNRYLIEHPPFTSIIFSFKCPFRMSHCHVREHMSVPGKFARDSDDEPVT